MLVAGVPYNASTVVYMTETTGTTVPLSLK